MTPKKIDNIKKVSFELFEDNTFLCKVNGRTDIRDAVFPFEQGVRLARVLSRTALELWFSADYETNHKAEKPAEK